MFTHTHARTHARTHTHTHTHNRHTLCCPSFPNLIFIFHRERAAVAIDTASAASTAVTEQVLSVPSTAGVTCQSSLPVCERKVLTAASAGDSQSSSANTFTAMRFQRSSLLSGLKECPQTPLPLFPWCPAGGAVRVNNCRHTQRYRHCKGFRNVESFPLVPWRWLQRKQAARESRSRSIIGRSRIQHPTVFGRCGLATAAVITFENFQLFWESFLQWGWRGGIRCSFSILIQGSSWCSMRI